MIAPRCWPAVVVVVSWVSLTPAEEFSGKVVGVSDGDTITVLQNRTPIKVRLHGIDCPEIGQDFGSRAKAFTSELVFGQVVKVVPRDTDRYGRTVADIILADGRILNHELVRAGLAWWYRKYAPDIGTLAELEAAARDAKRGLWSQPNPVPPWEWRKTKGEAQPGEVHREPANPRLSQAGVPERGLHLPGQSHAVQLGRRGGEGRVPRGKGLSSSVKQTAPCASVTFA